MPIANQEKHIVKAAINAFMYQTGFALKLTQNVQGQQMLFIQATEATTELEVMVLKGGVMGANVAFFLARMLTNMQGHVVILDQVTADIAEELRKKDIQFIDTVGNGYINQPPIYLFINGNKRKGIPKAPAGKSTLVRQVINHLIRDKGIPPRNILFLNLENPQFRRYRNDVSYLERAYEDYLKLVAPQGTVYCFLDEVHFFTEWQVFVKARYELQQIKFIVTGSNSHLLSSEYITLLSGRALPVEFYPFSFAEYACANGVELADAVAVTRERNRLRNLFAGYLCQGGFPETTSIKLSATQKEVLVMSARNILYQDIAPRFAIKKAVELENMFFYLASNISSLYSFNKLAPLVGLKDKTVKEYMSYFSDAYLLFTLDLFAFSVKEQIRSPKKIYAIDTGMAGAAGFSFSENRGHLLENLVYLELKRRGNELHYYKTANGHKVDFACSRKGKITNLIQVVLDLGDDRTRNRELRALVKALDETDLKSGEIVTYEEEGELSVDGKQIRLVPAFQYLLNPGVA